MLMLKNNDWLCKRNFLQKGRGVREGTKSYQSDHIPKTEQMEEDKILRREERRIRIEDL